MRRLALTEREIEVLHLLRTSLVGGDARLNHD